MDKATYKTIGNIYFMTYHSLKQETNILIVCLCNQCTVCSRYVCVCFTGRHVRYGYELGLLHPSIHRTGQSLCPLVSRFF